MDRQTSLAIESHPPPDNCSVCLLQEQRSLDEVSMVLQGGVAWHGASYHVHDFVMLKANKGPCHIGQIKSINVPDRATAIISVRLLGRVSTMETRPESVDKDEVRACCCYHLAAITSVLQRHLFLTDDQLECGLEYIIRSCSVVHPDAADDLDSWLCHSPFNFYCRYKFPSIDSDSWYQKQSLTRREIFQCATCALERMQDYRNSQIFKTTTKPLRTFDPFGGVGAFGHGLEQSGCIRVTHSVEISPSASETMR